MIAYDIEFGVWDVWDETILQYYSNYCTVRKLGHDRLLLMDPKIIKTQITHSLIYLHLPIMIHSFIPSTQLLFCLMEDHMSSLIA